MAWPDTSLTAEVKLELNASLTADPTTYAFATDITSLTFDRDGDSSIVIRRGRQDEQSQTPPSTCDLTVDNTDGRFSPRNPTGTYYGGLRRNTPIRVRVNPGTGLTTRYVGFVSEWPPRWDVREVNHNVPVRANGILRRLGQGATPLKSAMLRRVLSPDEPTPGAYWPCEDGTASTVVASGLPGGSPMIGVPVFASGFGGSAGSLDLTTADEAQPDGFVTLSSISGFQLEFMAKSASGATEILVEIVCGTLDQNLAIGSSSADGQPHHLAFKCIQNGGNVDISSYKDGVFSSTTSVAGVLATLLKVAIRGNCGTGTALAHVAVYNFADIALPTTRAPAALAYAGELSGIRVARLCTEESIPHDVTGGSTEAMGAQTAQTPLDLMRECEAVEEGLLVERLDGRLGFDPHADRENQGISLTLDYSSRHVSPPFEPTDDDQRIRNDVTVTRTGGAKAQVVDTTGPVGVTAVGRYDEGVTLNLSTDDQPYFHAGWRVNLGTVDGLRFPTVTVNLRRNNSLTAAFLALDIGSRIKITNLPDVVSFDDVDLIVEGYTEQISQKNWVITFNCAPYRPYKVFTVGEEGLVLPGTSGNYASTPDTGVLDVLGDIDLRADLSMTDWTPAANSTLISKRGAAGQRSYLFQVLTTGVLSLTWSADGTATITDNSTVAPTVTDGERLAVRVTLDVNNGAAGHTTTFYTAPTMTGTFTQLGSTVITAGTTSIFNSTAPAEVGTFNGGASDILAGTVHSVEIRDGIAGTVVANPDFAAQASATTSFADAAGRTWTVNGTARTVGSEYLGRLDWDTCVLAANITSVATSITTTTTPLITTTAADFPLTIICGGERMTVTACSGSSNPQTLTVTRSVNGVVKAHTSGDAVTIDEPMVLAL